MTAIFLVWEPDRRNGWNYTAAVEHATETGQFHCEWRAAAAVPAGSDAWLLVRANQGTGLLGHGAVINAQACDRPPHAVTGTPPSRLLVAFDSLLPLGDQLGPEHLQYVLPDVDWDGVRHGQRLEPHGEARIRDLWRVEGPAPSLESTVPAPGTYPAWAVTTVAVNRYERDPEARRACIAHFGTNCAACGFSFEIAYGEAGREFIDVHHTVPVSLLGDSYRLDPITDLVPLCANCHSMAHIGVTTPRTLSELRQMLAGAGYLRGQTLAPGELESRNEALRILGPANADPGQPPFPEH
jgi:5-methylcytosine-specific restriction protein A